MENTTKTCTQCNEPKPLTEFHRTKSTKSGRRAYCRSCGNARNRRTHYGAEYLARYFWTKVERTPDNECDTWTAAKKPSGYGIFQGIHAHRVAWSAFHGRPIPEGFDIDHTCNRGRYGCVDVRHLEAVTKEEHVRRGNDRRRFRSPARNS